MQRVVTVMPVGPACELDFVLDSLETVRHHLPGGPIIVVDDSGRGLGAEAAAAVGAALLTSPADYPRHRGRVYLALSSAFEYALDHFDFDLLVKFDTDAVIAGSTFVDLARDAVAAEPAIGSIGSMWPSGLFGTDRAFRSFFRQLLDPRFVRRQPRGARRVAKLLVEAARCGIPVRRYIFGGVALYTQHGLASMRTRGVLGDREIAEIDVSEDHLFTWLLAISGCTIAELDRPDHKVCGLEWQRLPASPEDLLAGGYELIHSVRKWEDRGEAEIRAVFRAARERAGAPRR